MVSWGRRLEFGWIDMVEEWAQMQIDHGDGLGRRKKGSLRLRRISWPSCFSSCHPCPWLVADDKHNWGITAHAPSSYLSPSVPRTDVPLPTDSSTAG